jgi:hypothetical protein
LPKEDVEYNQDLEKVRRRIEFTIGSLKARFDTLAKTWRNDRRWITTVVRFCAAMHNNIVFTINILEDMILLTKDLFRNQWMRKERKER